MPQNGNIINVYGRNYKARIIENIGAINNIILFIAEDVDKSSRCIIGYTCDEFYVISDNCRNYDEFIDEVENYTYSYIEFIKKKIQYERSVNWIKDNILRVIDEYNKNVKWYGNEEVLIPNEIGILIPNKTFK